MRDKEKRQDEGEMTVEEAGRKGGEAVKEKFGAEFYSEIGKKAHQEHPDLAERAGHMGGEATKERHGPEFYEEIGRKGGQSRGGSSEDETEEE